jgi:hypothetical protein
MEISNEISTEIKEIAPFLGNKGLSRVPYTLPAGYFEDFAEILMNRIQFEMAGMSGQEAAQEIAEISPLLAGLQKKNPYQVQEGYFDGLKAKIPGRENNGLKLVAVNSGKLLGDTTRSRTKRASLPSLMMKYAVAACLIGLLGITIYKLNNQSLPDPLHGLTTVSDQDMANYLDTDDIHWTPGLAPETAFVEFTDNDIHTLFSNVSDAELEQYHPELPSEKGKAN